MLQTLNFDDQPLLAKLDGLVFRVVGGETEAFDEIMKETEGRVTKHARKMLRDWDLARDASQDVHLRMFKFLGLYEAGTFLLAWAGRITVNVCNGYLKAWKHEGRVREDLDVFELLADPDSHRAEIELLRLQYRGMIKKALSTLTAAERAAFTLRELDGLPAKEAARLLGVRPSTVRVQVFSARKKIGEFLRQVLNLPKGGGMRLLFSPKSGYAAPVGDRLTA